MFIIFEFIVIAISRIDKVIIMNIFINAFINLSLPDDNYVVLEENLWSIN
jgi:hypothetical protein